MWSIIAFLLIGIAPSFILAVLGIISKKNNTPESWHNCWDIERLLDWIMPGIAVVSILPIQKSIAPVTLILFVFMWLCIFAMVSRVLSFIYWNMRSKKVFTIKQYVEGYFVNVSVFATVSAILIAWQQLYTKSFPTFPSVSLYVVIMFSIQLGKYIFMRNQKDTTYEELTRLAPCEFGTRICEIAEKIGHGIQGIFIAEVREHEYAGGLAIDPSNIVLTSDLLKRCNTDEVDFVVAHEIAHAAEPHFWNIFTPVCTLMWLVWCVLSVIMWNAIDRLPGSLNFLHYILWILIFLIPRLAMKWFSRIQEGNASGATSVLEKPEARISCMYKMYRIDQIPLSSPWWTRLLQSHPSFIEDAADVTAQFRISEDELERIKKKADDELIDNAGEHYEPVFHKPKQIECIAYPNRREFMGKSKYLNVFLVPVCFGLLAYFSDPVDPSSRWLQITTGIVVFAGIILLIWKNSRKKMTVEFRKYYNEVENKIRDINQLDTETDYVLVEMYDMPYWQTEEWQPALLVFKENQLTAFGEFENVSINAESVVGVEKTYFYHEPLDMSTAVIAYQINGLPQWLFLKTPLYKHAGNPANCRKLIELIKSSFMEYGPVFVDRKAGHKQILASVGRGVFSLLLISLIEYLVWTIGLLFHWQLSSLVYILAPSYLLTPLYNWSRATLSN